MKAKNGNTISTPENILRTLRDFCPHCGSSIPPRFGEVFGPCCEPYQATYDLRKARKKAYDRENVYDTGDFPEEERR